MLPRESIKVYHYTADIAPYRVSEALLPRNRLATVSSWPSNQGKLTTRTGTSTKRFTFAGSKDNDPLWSCSRVH